MRTFVQLKDGIGFAVVNTASETEGIEVAEGTGEQYLNKVYNNGSWSDAPVIWFAELNYDGSILEVRKTVFPSDVGNRPILTPDVKPHSRWVDGAWEQIIDVEPVSQTQELPAPAPLPEQTVVPIPSINVTFVDEVQPPTE